MDVPWSDPQWTSSTEQRIRDLRLAHLHRAMSNQSKPSDSGPILPQSQNARGLSSSVAREPQALPSSRSGKVRFTRSSDSPAGYTSMELDFDNGKTSHPATDLTLEPHIVPRIGSGASNMSWSPQSSTATRSSYGGSSTNSLSTAPSSAYSGSYLTAANAYEHKPLYKQSVDSNDSFSPLSNQQPSFHREKPGFLCTNEGCNSKGRFSRKTDFIRHLESVHGYRRFDCPYIGCGRKGQNGFTRWDHRHEHMREVHSEILDQQRVKQPAVANIGEAEDLTEQKRIDCSYKWCERQGYNGFRRMDHYHEHLLDFHLFDGFEVQQEHLLVGMGGMESDWPDYNTTEAQALPSGRDIDQLGLATLASVAGNVSERAENRSRNFIVPRHLKAKVESAFGASARSANDGLRSNALTGNTLSSDQFPVLATSNRPYETSVSASDDYRSTCATPDGSSSSKKTEDSQDSTKDRMSGILSSILLQSYLRLARKQATISADQQNDAEQSQYTGKNAKSQESSRSTRNGSKRKELNSGDEQPSKGKDRQNPKRPRHGTGTGTDTNISERALACPFNKYDNRLFGPGSPDEAYRACATCSFMNIAHLKQHLQRNHYLPQHYCYRCCKRDFSSQAMLAQHLRQEPICNKLEPPLYTERIGPDLIEELGLDRKNPSGTDRVEYWYRIYNTFFPSASSSGLPSPYYEGPAADYLNRFLHFSTLALDELIPGVRRRLGMMGDISPDGISRLIQTVQQEAGQQYLQRISNTLMPRLGHVSAALSNNTNNSLDLSQPFSPFLVELQEIAPENMRLARIEEQNDSLPTSSGTSSTNPDATLSTVPSTLPDLNLPKKSNDTLQFASYDDEHLNSFICEIPNDALIESLDWETEIDMVLPSKADWVEPSADS